MKLIAILAIILTVQCVAQQPPSIAVFSDDDFKLFPDSIEYSFVPADFHSEPYMYMTDDSIIYIMRQRVVTDRDYQRFVNWCNDSIHYSHHYMVVDSILKNGYTFHYDTINTSVYPTFEGFYKWLEQTK